MTALDRGISSLTGSQTAVALNAATGKPNQLRRILGISDLVLMILGTVIGSGISEYREANFR